MKPLLLSLVLAGSLAVKAMALPNPPEVIPVQGGSIRITPIFHASMQIEFKGKVIQVDPFSGGDANGAREADVVLLTDIHPDHLDFIALSKVMKSNSSTILVAPPAVRRELDKAVAEKKLPRSWIEEVTPQQQIIRGIGVQGIPMYNLKRGPKPGQKFHTKGRGSGYILTLGGKRIYIAGDTEATPEMKALKNIDIAFLPMNLPFTMTPQEAAAGAKAFKPKVVYPYHYRYPFDKPNDNPQQFAKALEGSGITVKLRGWYAHPAPK